MNLRIGVMGALEEEIEFLRDSLGLKQDGDCLGKSLYRGQLLAKEVALTSSGVGKVRAAAQAQCLIDRYKVERFIFVGIAGAINPELDPGDVVVSQRALQHDYYLPPGTLHPENLMNCCEADPQLAALALTAGEGLSFRVRSGLVLSGDQVIGDRARKEGLWRDFRGDCVEMEGAAVAMVCHLNRVPFVLIRGISDRADDNLRRDARQWLKEASQRAARVAFGLLSLC